MMVLLLIVGCSGVNSRSDPINVLLITIDTLRADHLSCYGYGERTSPHIDELSRAGVVFEKAFAQIPNTNASHSSIMTAKYPRRHGVLRLGEVLDPRNKTLAEILKARGFVTAAFVSAFALDSRFGLMQGFDSYVEVYERKEFSVSGMATADRVNQAVLPWLRANGDRAFFLWVHYFDPHLPYSPPTPYDGRFSKGPRSEEIPGFEMRDNVLKGARTLSRDEVAAFVGKYDGEIAFTDRHVGLLLEEFEKLGLRERTLVILTADHGENLHEHDRYFGHEYLLYEPSLRVPLILSFPGVIPAGIRVEEQVELVDILPTVLEALGREKEGWIDGVSLLSSLPEGGEADDRKVVFFETFPSHRPYAGSVRTASWKYIEVPQEKRRELYELENDPSESHNLIAEREDVAGELASALERWRSMEGDREAENLLDAETIERLKRLGYLQGE